jgi:hypothetical protein
MKTMPMAQRMALLEKRMDEQTSRARIAELSNRVRATTSELTEESLFRDYSREARDRYAKEGVALSDGSYPIKTVQDLKNAIRAYGRSADSDKFKVRRHIIKRARALGKTEMVPSSWSADAMELAIVEQRDRMSALSASVAQQHSDLYAHDLVFWSETSLPRAVRSSSVARSQPGFGDMTKRRAASDVEERLIASKALTASATPQDVELAAALQKLRVESITAAVQFRKGDWEEKEHPRDNDGLFRDKIARLTKVVEETETEDEKLEGGSEARARLEDARIAMDEGRAGDAAKALLNVEDIIDRRGDGLLLHDPSLVSGNREAGRAISDFPFPHREVGMKYRYTDLPPVIKDSIDSMMQKVENALTEETADKVLGPLRGYISGDDLMHTAEIQGEMARMIAALLAVGPNQTTEDDPEQKKRKEK